MITTKLKTILTAAGCTLVLYESDKLANLVTDQSDNNDIVGLILQPNAIKVIVKANSKQRQYPPIMIEVLKQVGLESSAEDNEVTLEALFVICESIIDGLIDSGVFKKITDMTLLKIPQNKYDANFIGWAMPLELIELENKNNC